MSHRDHDIISGLEQVELDLGTRPRALVRGMNFQDTSFTLWYMIKRCCLNRKPCFQSGSPSISSQRPRMRDDSFHLHIYFFNV